MFFDGLVLFMNAKDDYLSALLYGNVLFSGVVVWLGIHCHVG